jgi:DNA-binding transcriptional MerR regulator
MELSITELADAVGISRRAVRFYVQRGLIPAPTGLGRGRHYDETHLERLKQIRELQNQGHALDAIAKILAGEQAPPPPSAPRVRPTLSAELWTRLTLADGVELNLDARRINPTAEQLLAIRESIRSILEQDKETL